MITKPSKAVIMDASTKEFRKFQFNPIPIEEDINIKFEEISSPGLSHPFFQYISGNADTITFDIELDDAGEHFGYTGDFINFMYRFRPPRNSKRFSPPPPVTLSYGTYVRTGIIMSMPITRRGFDAKTLKVTKAVIKVTIKSIVMG